MGSNPTADILRDLRASPPGRAPDAFAFRTSLLKVLAPFGLGMSDFLQVQFYETADMIRHFSRPYAGVLMISFILFGMDRHGPTIKLGDVLGSASIAQW